MSTVIETPPPTSGKAERWTNQWLELKAEVIDAGHESAKTPAIASADDEY